MKIPITIGNIFVNSSVTVGNYLSVHVYSLHMFVKSYVPGGIFVNSSIPGGIFENSSVPGGIFVNSSLPGGIFVNSSVLEEIAV